MKKQNRSRQSLAKQKELIAKMQKLRTGMKSVILTKVTDDAEVADMMSKTYQNMLGRTEEEKKEISRLLDEYNNAPINQKEDFLKRLPPYLRMEVSRASILSKPIASEVTRLNPPGAPDPRIAQILREMNQLRQLVINGVAKRGDLNNIYNDLRTKIDNMQADLNTIPGVGDLDVKLAELSAELKKIGNDLRKDLDVKVELTAIRRDIEDAKDHNTRINTTVIQRIEELKEIIRRMPQGVDKKELEDELKKVTDQINGIKVVRNVTYNSPKKGKPSTSSSIDTTTTTPTTPTDKGKSKKTVKDDPDSDVSEAFSDEEGEQKKKSKVPGLDDIMDNSVAYDSPNRLNISFARGKKDPVKGLVPIFTQNVSGNDFYIRSDELRNGEVTVYNHSNNAVITKKATPGLVRLLLNDKVNESDVHAEDISDYNEILDDMGYRLPANLGAALQKKMKTFRVPYILITEKGIEKGKAYEGLKTDIDNRINFIASKRRGASLAVMKMESTTTEKLINEIEKRIDYINANRGNPEFKPFQAKIDANLKRFTDLQTRLVNELKKYVTAYQKKGGDKDDLGFVQMLGLGLNRQAKPIQGTGIKIFTSKAEVEHRLQLLKGSRSAGNDSKEVAKEIRQLEKLLK